LYLLRLFLKFLSKAGPVGPENISSGRYAYCQWAIKPPVGELKIKRREKLREMSKRQLNPATEEEKADETDIDDFDYGCVRFGSGNSPSRNLPSC